MIHAIQRPGSADDGIVALLAACHARIRSFSALAVRLADVQGGDTSRSVLEACVAVTRYFQEALPLHVRDEEDTVLPRLWGQSLDLDRTLLGMRAQHAEHETIVTDLLVALEAVAAQPADSGPRDRLRGPAQRVAVALEEHLVVEERTLFPVLAVLPKDIQAQMVTELRARRTDR